MSALAHSLLLQCIIDNVHTILLLLAMHNWHGEAGLQPPGMPRWLDRFAAPMLPTDTALGMRLMLFHTQNKHVSFLSKSRATRLEMHCITNADTDCIDFCHRLSLLDPMIGNTCTKSLAMAYTAYTNDLNLLSLVTYYRLRLSLPP